MDFLNDYSTVLVLAFVVFVVFLWQPKTVEQTAGAHRRGRRGHRGRRDYFGYYGNYWDTFNPWRINNPCASYAARKCRGNYYYEPCYESKYFRCMNSTYYA